MDHDLHGYGKRLEGQLRILESAEWVLATDKDLIRRFIDSALAEGISKGRIVRYLFDLKVWARLFEKEFEKCSIDDVRRAVGRLEASKYAKSTKRDLKLTLRKFFRWLRGTEDYPPEVKWIPTHMMKGSVKSPEDLLEEDEVDRMVRNARNPMLRAFITTLYESGCRVGEILPMKISQVRFDDHGAQMMVSGKTGFRRIRIFSSVPYLTDWLNRHPNANDPKSWLWLNRTNHHVSYTSMCISLKRTAELAGIKKKVNFHNFRHSRATFLANHLTEAQMKEYFGWVQDSSMASIYIHLSGRDVDQALFRLHGIEQNGKNQEDHTRPRRCTRCGVSNQATNRFCKVCGHPLEKGMIRDLMDADQKRHEADRKMDCLIHDSEFREMFLRKLDLLGGK